MTEYVTDGEQRLLPLEAIQLVGIDLDGTLLRSDGRLCPSAAAAIKAASQRGVKVVLATARAPRAVRAIHAELGLDTPIVCQNGALIYDLAHDEILLHRTIPAEDARRVIEIARQVDVAQEVELGIDVADRRFTQRSGKGWMSAALRQPVTRIVMTGPPHVLGGVRIELQQHLRDTVNFCFSDLILLQVVAAEADKAYALQYLADRFGIAHQQTMAIGDAPNDLGMIRWAALGVSLYNAWDEVQQAAHFVMPTNDAAGVAKALRTYVLMQ